MVQATRGLGLYNVDEFRWGIERMDPARYLAASYYERWLATAETNLIEKEVISRAELDARTDRLREQPDAPPPTRTDPGLIARVRAGQPRDWPPRFDPARQRFALGDAVVARNVHPRGHTRLPRYVRGKRGTVTAVRGLQVLPDANAHGRDAPPEMVYSVQFDGRELWGDSAEPGQALSIDLWESYLEGRGEAVRP
jgi:nitrile hydratase